MTREARPYAAAWLVARGELRRRRRSLLVLVLLVAFVSATVSTALVGAHRSATSVDRFRVWADASDGSFQSSDQEQADRMLAVAAQVPGVTAIAQRRLVNAFLDGNPLSDIAVLSDPENRFGVAVDRPMVLAGRFPRPDAPDEVMLNELAARLTGLHVGDRVTARTWSDADLEALFGGTGFPGFHGPLLDLHVVGVGRFVDELPGEVQRTSPYALASARFLEDHPGVGVWPAAVVVRVDGGAAGLDRVARALGPVQVQAGSNAPTGSFAAATSAAEVYVDTARRAANSVAIGLLLFALTAGLAGAVVIGQALVRHLGASAPSTRILQQLGIGRSGIAIAASIPIGVAAAAGAVLGALGAVAASPLLPIGLARRAEVEPGRWVDPLILVPVAVLAVVALALLGTALSVRSVAPPPPGRPRQSMVMRAIARLGVSPTVATGVQLATDRGHAGRALPVRSALTALAIGVAGVAGAAVVSSSFDDLVARPASWGWNWSSMPDQFQEGDNLDVTARLVADQRLSAVGEFTTGSVGVNGVATTGYAMTALSGDVSLTSRRGRLPSGPGEVALGERTMKELGVAIGDTVDVALAGGGASRRFTVVGAVVLPPSETYALDVGVAFTPDALTAVLQDEPSVSIVLTYPKGSDVPALQEALSRDYGFQFTPFATSSTPGSVRNISVAGDIARALAWFFAILGLLGLLHALVASRRRRSTHIAVLRALGMERRHVRRAVIVQSFVLGTLAVLVGLPAGLILGRTVWRLLVSNTAVIAPPSVPWGTVAVLVPATILATLLVAWWPGRMLARQDPRRYLGGE